MGVLPPFNGSRNEAEEWLAKGLMKKGEDHIPFFLVVTMCKASCVTIKSVEGNS
jgi:hypothetical protein